MRVPGSDLSAHGPVRPRRRGGIRRHAGRRSVPAILV